MADTGFLVKAKVKALQEVNNSKLGVYYGFRFYPYKNEKKSVFTGSVEGGFYVEFNIFGVKPTKFYIRNRSMFGWLKTIIKCLTSNQLNKLQKVVQQEIDQKTQ